VNKYGLFRGSNEAPTQEFEGDYMTQQGEYVERFSNINVTYKSGTHPTQGWDVMQVIYSQGGRAINSFVIARDAAGTVLRKTDIVFDRWEIVNDADDLRGFKKCFDDRDKLAAEMCGCGHTFSVHTRNVLETDSARADDALRPQRGYDIFSDKAVGESGCSECSCRQYKPAGY